MKIYISGKITGLDIKEAQENFSDAARALSFSSERIWFPVNPMKLVPVNEAYTWKDYMIKDIELLFDCEAIYMLRNWKDSQGARVEHAIANELKLEIKYQ